MDHLADYCTMTHQEDTNGRTDLAGSAEQQARSTALRLLARMIARAYAKGPLLQETDGGIEGSAGVKSERTIANDRDRISQQ